MKKITFTLIVLLMSLGTVFSQTEVTPVLYLPFDTEIIPDGEDRVSIVDSVDAVHHDPTTPHQRWMDYPGGALVDTSQLADTTMDRGTVLQIDDHTFFKVEEKFFEGKDQWTMSYWHRWLYPQGWWTSHAIYLGTQADTLVSGFTHWQGWYGKGDLVGLGGLLGAGFKWENKDWLHVTITYHDSTLTYYLTDTVYSQGAYSDFKHWETLSYLISFKCQFIDQTNLKLHIEKDSAHSYCQEVQMDDFRLFDIALTGDEVAALHNDQPVMRTYISSITLDTESGETIMQMENDSLQMTADIAPLDASWPHVAWSVENGTGSATIDGMGLLKPEAIGTVTVKATATDGSGISATKEITIQGIMVTDIVVSSDAPGDSVEVDQSIQMLVDVNPADASDPSVTWSVVNGTGIALIDENGELVGVLAGTVEVIATANDGSSVTGTLEVIIYETTGFNTAANSAVKVYPNPSDGTFKVSLTDMQPVEYTVYNVVGAKIQSGILKHNETLKLKTSDKGFYYLRLDTSKGLAVKKLIVK